MIEHLAVKPPGRPSAKPKAFFHDFSYRVKSWKRSRRVIAKVEWHQGELLPRTGFIVTSPRSCSPRFLPASGPWPLFRYEVIGKIKGRSIE